MNTRYSILLVAVVALGSFLYAVRSSEPTCQNRPLSAWLEDLDSTAVYTQETAREAFRQMGTNAVAPLIEILHARDSRLKIALIRLSQKQSLVRIPFVLPSDRHIAAIKACRALGPSAHAAIPELIRALDHSSTANEAAYSLVVIDENIFPLTRAFTNQNNDAAIRCSIAARLSSSRYQANEVVPLLIDSLKDRNAAVSAQAAHSLGVIGTGAEAAVPALNQALRRREPLVRKEAERALKKINSNTMSQTGKS